MIPHNEAFWRTGSTVILIGVAPVLLLWTGLALRYGGPDATLSSVFNAAVERWRGLLVLTVFGLGLLAGHLFWPLRVSQ